VRVLTIVGNRPQFVKAAAVSVRLRRSHTEVLVHSGQHYDDELSAVFFRELDLPPPDHELGVGSGSHAEQIAAVMHGLEPIARRAAPELALVYGDTNTTLAGALAAARLGLPLAHVEAGMRSFDPSMPEERNRVIADHVSSLLLCPTPTAVENLRAEGVDRDVRLVGDVMADVTLMMAPVAERESKALERFELEPSTYVVVTVHRAGNVDAEEPLQRLVELLESLPLPAVFPVHPRTRARLEAAGAMSRLEAHEDLRLSPPLGYLDFLQLLRHARAVLTDSGGVQKEAYLLEVPCLTLRETTEWVETVELGWNRLVGLDAGRALEALATIERPAERPQLYGGGQAGERVVAAIEEWAASIFRRPPSGGRSCL
jgi:UDP-N-acetylglucosamine 2-epimerase (non-hydrolysing)/UDP-GlcNAc3NAcA epimerase